MSLFVYKIFRDAIRVQVQQLAIYIRTKIVDFIQINTSGNSLFEFSKITRNVTELF